MEVNDYYRFCMRMTEQLAPKISPTYRGMVVAHDSAGAWDMAITTLIGALSEEDVAITTAQKDTLRELMVYLEQPTTRVEQIRTAD